MRSSSIKTLAATATLIAIVTLAAAPTAHAATRTERAKQTVTRLLQRIAKIATLGLPGDPIPVSAPLTDATATEETTPISPKKTR